MGFTVIIPSRNADNVDRCVDSIREQDEGCRVLVVDDGLERRRDDCEYVEGIQPFVYARNINRGIKACSPDDVILLNDDAVLKTEQGLTSLRVSGTAEQYGVVSAAINGNVCNDRQNQQNSSTIRLEHGMVAFVCVYMRREVIERVGLLDERFVGYGLEDRDYCRRVHMSGLKVGIWDGCVVDHSDDSRSTFRTRDDWERIYAENRRLFRDKWSSAGNDLPGPRGMPKHRVDLLYQAKNRLEFTQESLGSVYDNTDWDLVNRLFVYDDGSVDGTREFLCTMSKNIAANNMAHADFITSNFGDPIGPMRDAIQRSGAYYLAKLDNDVIVPPKWLSTAVKVLQENESLDLLGIEDHLGTCDPNMETPRSYEESNNIGGVGVFRKSAFETGKFGVTAPYCGFWDWQNQNPEIKKGWLKPGIPLFLLDRLPFQPWKGFSKIYEDRLWQRHWWSYKPEEHAILWSWKYPKEVAA